MIVQCTSCRARFRVAEEKVPERGAKMRCTKCSHVFKVTRPETERREDSGEASGGTPPQLAPAPLPASPLTPLPGLPTPPPYFSPAPLPTVPLPGSAEVTAGGRRKAIANPPASYSLTYGAATPRLDEPPPRVELSPGPGRTPGPRTAPLPAAPGGAPFPGAPFPGAPLPGAPLPGAPLPGAPRAGASGAAAPFPAAPPSPGAFDPGLDAALDAAMAGAPFPVDPFAELAAPRPAPADPFAGLDLARPAPSPFSARDPFAAARQAPPSPSGSPPPAGFEDSGGFAPVPSPAPESSGGLPPLLGEPSSPFGPPRELSFPRPPRERTRSPAAGPGGSTNPFAGLEPGLSPLATPSPRDPGEFDLPSSASGAREVDPDRFGTPARLTPSPPPVELGRLGQKPVTPGPGPGRRNRKDEKDEPKVEEKKELVLDPAVEQAAQRRAQRARLRREFLAAVVNVASACVVGFAALAMVASIRSPRPLRAEDIGFPMVWIALGFDDGTDPELFLVQEVVSGTAEILGGGEIFYVTGLVENASGASRGPLHVAVELTRGQQVLARVESLAGLGATPEDLRTVTSRKNDDLQTLLLERAQTLTLGTRTRAPFVAVLPFSAREVAGTEVRLTAGEGVPANLRAAARHLLRKGESEAPRPATVAEPGPADALPDLAAGDAPP